MSDGLVRYEPERVSLTLMHVSDCRCRYVLTRDARDETKLIDTRCIGAYLVPVADGARMVCGQCGQDPHIVACTGRPPKPAPDASWIETEEIKHG